MTKARATGLLVALVMISGIPTLAVRAAGEAPEGPGCQSVAFMSMTGVGPACGR
ncbi:hypothetical protein [Streptomyces sp. NPDC006879]|uniref:hypothetical protein n=1 Tax=Streptomyces sp. NPDC006879 TaxID=3364767 RepID=UPI003676A00A